MLLIRNLLSGQQASVQTEHGECYRFNVEKGVRQGCILSPYLFNLYSEMIMRKAGLENMEEGAEVGGRKTNDLRYADNTALLAENQDDLKRVLKRVKDKSKKTQDLH